MNKTVKTRLNVCSRSYLSIGSDWLDQRLYSRYNVLMAYLFCLCLQTESLTWQCQCFKCCSFWFKETWKAKPQNVTGSCLDTGKLTTWVNIVVMPCPHLPGVFYRLKMKVENILSDRATEGIFKAAYSAWTNVLVFKYTCGSTESTWLTHENTEKGRTSDDTT